MYLFGTPPPIFEPGTLRYGKNPEAEKQAALLAKQEEESAQKQAETFEPWVEPQTLESLQDKYILEAKFSGRVPGATMILCQAKRRDGSIDQVVGNQKMKLFIVTSRQLIFPKHR